MHKILFFLEVQVSSNGIIAIVHSPIKKGSNFESQNQTVSISILRNLPVSKWL